MRRKVFVYVTRPRAESVELLVFTSLNEPGYEAPKGSVEPGESLEQAVHREVHEESGIAGLSSVQELGITQWRDEEQHFFLAQAPAGLADVFEYEVTGEGIDRGYRYQYRWLEVNRGLGKQLVQGSNRFVEELIAAVGVPW